MRTAHVGPGQTIGDIGVCRAHRLITFIGQAHQSFGQPPSAGTRYVAGIRAVIGHEQNQSVVEAVGHAQVLQQATDVNVHVVDHGRIHRHLSGFCPLLSGRQAVPGRHALGARRVFQILVDEAAGFELIKTLSAQDIPALTIGWLMPGDTLG